MQTPAPRKRRGGLRPDAGSRLRPSYADSSGRSSSKPQDIWSTARKTTTGSVLNRHCNILRLISTSCEGRPPPGLAPVGLWISRPPPVRWGVAPHSSPPPRPRLRRPGLQRLEQHQGGRGQLAAPRHRRHRRHRIPTSSLAETLSRGNCGNLLSSLSSLSGYAHSETPARSPTPSQPRRSPTFSGVAPWRRSDSPHCFAAMGFSPRSRHHLS